MRGNTVLAQPTDSGMIRVDEETGLGVAVSTDCNGRFAKLDPYAGAQLALAEAYRNVATGGARPLAISDCLNFGSPEDPDVMWQFAEACRGLKDACVELGIPVTGGNVSLYNQTGDGAILPTPVVAVLGVIDDVTRRTPTGFVAPGERVFLLGETREELSGSEWAHVVHDHLGGLPPAVDLAREKALAELLREAVGLVTSAHDLSDGGLAQALVESALRNDVGCRGVARRRPVRRAVLRVGGPGAGHRARRRRGPPRRPGRAPRRTGHRARRDRRRRTRGGRSLRRRPAAAAGRVDPHAARRRLADDLVVSDAWTVPAAELVERFSRSSGPGGQGVNTADTRVAAVLRRGGIGLGARRTCATACSSGSTDRLVDGVLTVTASEHRTQLDNRRAARERLAEVLREAAAPPPPKRRADRPTRGSKERRLTEKKRRGETKRGRQGRFD